MSDTTPSDVTTRDWFATMALQALLHPQASMQEIKAGFFTERAYAAADAMLAERSKPKQAS